MRSNNYKLRVIKTSLKSLTNQQIIDEIDRVVTRVNNITIDAYNFIKLYVIHCYENNVPMPIINQNFILNVLKTVTFNSVNTGRKVSINKNLSEKLCMFYNTYFKQLDVKQEDCKNLSHILVYVATDMVTNIINNIKLHFTKHLTNFIRFLYKKINTCVKKYELTKVLHAIVNNKISITTILSETNYKKIKRPKLYMFIDYIKSFYLPKLKCKNLSDDIDKYPFKYLFYMIKMNREIEKWNSQLTTENLNMKHKLYQVLPLRTNIIPKYIPIDTTIILDILADKGISNYYKGKSQSDIENIWKFYFSGLFKEKNKKLLKSNEYMFNNLIYTDGYAVSLIQINKKKKVYKSKFKKEFKYIDDLNDDELNKLKDYKLVGLDPGKRNIISMIDDDGKKFKYTCLQRRVECLFKQKKKVFNNLKTQEIIDKETELSKVNSKSCFVKSFSEYVKLKNIVNDNLLTFYKNEIFRKYKWKTYVHVQKSQSTLVNNIKNIYETNRKKICLMYGNWSEEKQMKNYLSTPGIGMKRLLEKHFKIVTIDEYKTSKVCFNCEHETEKFMIRNSPKPYIQGPIQVHSLLRCKNVICNAHSSSKSVSFHSANIKYYVRFICSNHLYINDY